MGKKKAKKLGKLVERVWHEALAQEERLKKVISEFHPEEVLAEFAEATQVWETLMESGTSKRFSEDEQTKSRCLGITKNAREKGSSSIDVDFFKSQMWFRNINCFGFMARIMYKADQADNPIYMKHEHEYGSNGDMIVAVGCTLRFLVNSDRKEAFLVLDDLEAKQSEESEEFEGNNSSFINLSELHAIIYGWDNDMELIRCFIVDFTQDSDRWIAEEIYGWNRYPVYNFITPDSLDRTIALLPSLSKIEAD